MKIFLLLKTHFSFLNHVSLTSLPIALIPPSSEGKAVSLLMESVQTFR